MSKRETLMKVKKIITKCEMVLSSLETVKLAGKILRQSNYQISFQDAQIASLSLENKLSLLTLDEKDFKKIKGVKIFKV